MLYAIHMPGVDASWQRKLLLSSRKAAIFSQVIMARLSRGDQRASKWFSRRLARLQPAPGCVFRPRCQIAIDDCRGTVPGLREIRPDYWAACLRG
jgi:ABC-type dipeptide/oligopeptide/nickel transport system ATPase component